MLFSFSRRKPSRRAIATRNDVWFSDAYRQWTRYDVTLVDTRFHRLEELKRCVSRHPDMLKWATEDEIRRGATHDGADIAAFPSTLLAVDGLLGGSR